MIKKKINPKAKRLSLRVDQRDGQVKLTIPKWTPQWKIDRFLKKNEKWIEEKRALILPKINIEHGAGIAFTVRIYPSSHFTTDF